MADKPLASPTHEVDDSPEAVFELAIKNGWSDGLPIIPPTPDRVRRFVEHAKRDPQDVVCEVAPAMGKATVEKIAITAVMAGCLPMYMPVLIAAIRAMADPAFNLSGIQATTNPAAPLIIVNGPIRNQIGLHCGRGLLGPGFRANATIGRAVRLMMLNIGGGAIPDVDKSVHAQPAKFTFCMGELEEESPWEPYHVELGFSKQASTVTVAPVEYMVNCIPQYEDPKLVLHKLAQTMKHSPSVSTFFCKGNPVMLFNTGHARQLAGAGYSKQEVKRLLWQNSRISRDEWPPEMDIPFVELNIEDNHIVQYRRPEDLILLVAGGSELHVQYITGFGIGAAVTREVELPA